MTETYKQQTARLIYERIKDLINSSKATLFEARLLHNQLFDMTAEEFTQEVLDTEGFEKATEYNIFKPFQDYIEDSFSHWSLAEIWAGTHYSVNNELIKSKKED